VQLKWIRRSLQCVVVAALSAGCGVGGSITGPDDDSADAGADLADADPSQPDADPDQPDAPVGPQPDAAPGQPDAGDPSGGPPANPFGIGLVGPGNGSQWDRAAELSGRGGHIKLIFPGVVAGMAAPEAGWVTAVDEVYARDLVPVIRVVPPWGNRNLRDSSDDDSHMSYTGLAAAYAAVVGGLPRRAGWPLVIEVHNEPNLCYEWECNPANAPAHPDVPDGWMHYTHTAAEYAAFLRDVTAALRAIGDSRIEITNGGLAPGGAVSCQCGGDGFTAGITSREFLQAMEAAVPGVHAALDGFASHSYPAEGEGWGFFVAYAQAGPGLHYYQTELSTLGLDLPVYMTETGWTVENGASREQVADWTVSAWQHDWFPADGIAAVMPFMLQDGSWNNFAWIDGGGSPYPVFDAVRAWRCGMAFPDPC